MFLFKMIGLFIWNATEYAAYICIIIQTALIVANLFGKVPEINTSTDNSVNKLIGTLTNAANELLEQPKQPHKRTR